MSELVDDVDYQKDILKFKEIWKEIKNPPKGNLQTIQQKTQKIKKVSAKSSNPKKDIKKATIISNKNIQRNPKDNPQQIIQVVTKPISSYQDALRNQKNNQIKQHLILTASNNQTVNQVSDLKKVIQEINYQLSLSRVTNSRNIDKIRSLELQIQRKQDIILQLKARQRQLIAQTSSLNSKDFNFNYGKVEYENFKNDTRRLLKMLQQTNQYQQFATLALDDNCVRFLHETNKKVKTKIDQPNTISTNFHFCVCNKEFIQEDTLWVPQKTYDFGRKFIKDRNGQLTQPELELLLYQLNKIWREREKRIINSISSMKGKQIGQYQRKIKNLSKQKSQGD